MKYTNEQKARLNPEQLAVVEIYEQEISARAAIIVKMREAKDPVALKQAGEEMLRLLESQDKGCPHGRYVTCIACDEIDKLLWPERVCTQCEEVIDPDDSNKLDANLIDLCKDS